MLYIFLGLLLTCSSDHLITCSSSHLVTSNLITCHLITFYLITWSPYHLSPGHLVLQMVWKRLNDHGKNWRHVYKALVLLEYLIKTGSEKVRVRVRG